MYILLIKKPEKPGSDEYISHPIIPEHTHCGYRQEGLNL
jgi:hypothetical protein